MSTPVVPPTGRPPLATDLPAGGAEASTGDAGSGPDTSAPGNTEPTTSRIWQSWWTRSAVVLVIVAFGVILWGGYTQGWDWTGVSDKDTLWHWMQILMVPIAFAALPGVLRDHQALRTSRKIMMVSLVVLFVGFVIVSYVVPWDWTGFTGNTLWDWLSLLLLPIAIISVRFLRAERTLTWAHYVSAAVLVAGFGVLVFFGYVAPWDWTGFTGNTFLDWVQLLILPILFPTVVVPAAAAWLTAKQEREESLPVR